jgi:hypothetical protein
MTFSDVLSSRSMPVVGESSSLSRSILLPVELLPSEELLDNDAVVPLDEDGVPFDDDVMLSPIGIL